MAAHVEDDLLSGQLLQRALHLLNVRASVILLFAGRLRPQFVLLDRAQAIQPMLKVGDPLAV